MRFATGRLEAGRSLLGAFAERLSVEQVNAGLYYALSSRLDPFSPYREALERFLQQELRHISLVERTVRRFGGHPAASSPSARSQCASIASLQRIVQDSAASPEDCLEALLLAVLRDRLGWEKLVTRADALGLATSAWEFRGALLEEREQADTLARWREHSGVETPLRSA